MNSIYSNLIKEQTSTDAACAKRVSASQIAAVNKIDEADKEDQILYGQISSFIYCHIT